VAALGIVLGFALARRRSPKPDGEPSELDRGTQPGVQWPAAPVADVPLEATAAPTAHPAAPFKAPQPIDEVQIARVRLRPAVRRRA